MVSEEWVYQMKDKKIKKLIQKPLRFHHQDIHEELDEIKEILKDIVNKLEKMRLNEQKCYLYNAKNVIRL